MASSTPPRTLADQLRGWPDERLAGLLSARPDLASPTPQDSGQLASRAAVRSSLLRALELLDRTELAVLEALVVLGPQSLAGLQDVVHAAPDRVAGAARRLVDLALAWGDERRLRALTAVADGFAPGLPGSSGLRPASGVEDLPPVAERLAGLRPEAVALLEHVDAHGGEGTTSAASTASTASTRSASPARPGAGADGGDARGPVEELVARRLLLPRPGGAVVLPADVAVALRGGRTTPDPVDVRPDLATSTRDRGLVERAAAGAAFEAVRRTELLLETWSTRPPPVLRTGGLAVRDLKATATLLHVDEAEAALLVEGAARAGLLGQSAGADGVEVWAPTDAFDSWDARPVGERWWELAHAWLESPRMVGLVGTRDRAGKTWNALVPELSGTYAAETRRMVLEVLAGLAPGEVLASGTGVPSVVARLEWLRPRRPASRAELAGWAVAEAARLGVTGLGGLSGAGRALLEGDRAAALAALEPLLPGPVDHVLLQADLTAVAPGPLESGLARRLHAVADVESRGGATVHRFTPASVRRALDAGWTAAEVHELLASASRTPVPQSLTYLVDDVARTHGSIRVGHAEAFLRADDEAALAALLHDPRAAGLGLRRLAPTVLVSTLPLDLLLPRLRELGAAPVVEAPDGTVHVARPDAVRARRPRASRPDGADEARRVARVSAVVAAVRAGDRAGASRPASSARLSPADALARLREAAEHGRSVWIGYVDNHGATTERIVDPQRVDGGRLTAYDHRSEESRDFAVHRITGVRPV